MKSPNPVSRGISNVSEQCDYGERRSSCEPGVLVTKATWLPPKPRAHRCTFREAKAGTSLSSFVDMPQGFPILIRYSLAISHQNAAPHHRGFLGMPSRPTGATTMSGTLGQRWCIRGGDPHRALARNEIPMHMKAETPCCRTRTTAILVNRVVNAFGAIRGESVISQTL